MTETGPKRRRRKEGEGAAEGAAAEKSRGEEKPTNKPFQGRYNPKLSDKNASISHRTLAKGVMGAGVLVVVLWSKFHQDSTSQSLASVGEVVSEKRSQQFLCSPAYKKEILALDPSCLPTKCGRLVTDELVSIDEAHQLLKIAKKGLAKGGGAGGASILDLHSGALSHGEAFINLYLSHPNLFTSQDFAVYKQIKDRIKKALAEHFNLDNERLYLTHPTFFSELTAVPPATLHDEYWHEHVDKETYPSFHYTSLIYLADYRRDFTGGRFIFLDTHMKANKTIEPKEGRVAAFTSGPENKHRVEPVTGGTRYALTMGFTCDPSKAIAEPGEASSGGGAPGA